ncbi:trigger factor [Erysipelatoclostridium ramosum]|uniref:trigger factor n=1 Tax=Thomasclavelia ramosa TaxID=1547 RepID=UPI0018AB5F1F|nr:trigger factor [Thomasclavelia ramosa]MDB7094340.1 trigger factor [Thomasclavelia ramosa]
MSKVIKLGNYKGIEAEVTKQPVADTEVDNEIQRLVAQSTSLIEKDGDVTNGDVTTIDFEGFKDEVAFDGGKAEGFQLEIGSGQFIPGFEEQMIGMKKGETRELNLTFPENYGAADLAGADVVFKVTVHKIEEKKEAELNDAFVASLNAPGIETIDQLRDNIKASLEAQHEQAFMAAKENAALGKLIDDCEVEVEESDIEKALQQQLQHISMELASQGMQLEQYLQMMGMNQETLLQQLAPSAKQQATFEAIIDEIVAIENLETSNEEANQQVEAIAAHNQVSKEDVLNQIDIESLKRDLNRIKASRLIMDNTVFIEV